MGRGVMSLSKVVRAADVTAWQTPKVGKGRAQRSEHTDEQIKAIEQQARAKGYEVGRWEGLEAGHSEVMEKARRLAQLYDDAAHPFRLITENIEIELSKLAGAIAREIVKQELNVAPELILEAVNQACSVLSASARNIDVYLNPEDVALVKAALKEEPPAQHWRVVENRRMTRGDCQINSSEEFIDATLQTRIDGLVAGILSADIEVED